MRPIASAVSSQEKPSTSATGAQYLKVSLIMDTLVLTLEDVVASTSAKCPESAAYSLKAVRASVMISDVIARFIIHSMPSSISPVFQPVIAI